MKKCPFCAEDIQDDAVKCKHCSSLLSEDNSQNIKVKASQHASYGSISLLCFLLPAIGIILGIVYLTKDKLVDKKLGEHAIAFSFLAAILWSVIFFILL